jgi:hypothetical protein
MKVLSYQLAVIKVKLLMLINRQSEAQKLLFKSQCEVQSLQDLALLFEKSQTILKTQAFIMCKRIL